MPGFVYVVDDDAAFRAAIERRLKMVGYDVASFPSAQQFLENLPGESELGCVLLDVRMPGLNGPELQGRLRELGSTLPIVFLTGHSDVQPRCEPSRPVRRIFCLNPFRQKIFFARSNAL